VTAHNNRQILLIILHMPFRLGREAVCNCSYLSSKFPPERAGSALFGTPTWDVLLKYRSFHINEMFMWRYYRIECMPVAQFHAICNRCVGTSNVHC